MAFFMKEKQNSLKTGCRFQMLGLNGGIAFLFRADADDFLDIGHENFSVANLSRFSRTYNRGDGSPSTRLSGRTISILILGRKSTSYSLPR